MWESPHAQELVTTTLKLQVTCNKCFRILSDEESMSIVPLQVTSNVQTSLNIFLQTEELTESDSFFFFFLNPCESHQPASIDHEISKTDSYLILQLKFFVRHHGKFIKDIKKKCNVLKLLPCELL